MDATTGGDHPFATFGRNTLCLPGSLSLEQGSYWRKADTDVVCTPKLRCFDARSGNDHALTGWIFAVGQSDQDKCTPGLWCSGRIHQRPNHHRRPPPHQ